MLAAKLKKNHWFFKMSPEKQAAYIKDHPNSVYAKAVQRKKSSGKKLGGAAQAEARRKWLASQGR